MTAGSELGPEFAPTVPGFSLRSLLGDSGAVMVASVAAIVAGLIRTKIAAVQLGPHVVAILAQLTQLYVLILTVSIVGLGTGIRLVLARMSDPEQAAGFGRVLVLAATGVSIVLAAGGELFAVPLAHHLLGSDSGAQWVRIALLAVPLAVALQTSSAVVQARGEFRALATASIIGGVLAALATIALMLPSKVDLAIASLPVSAACQLVPLFLVTPTGRRLLRATWYSSREHLREVLTVGGITFGLTLVSSSADTLIRTRFVDVGGLGLVARLQPAMVFSTQGFGLVLGALSTTVLVRVTEQLAAHPDRDLTASFNAVARRLVVIVGVLALGLQACSGLVVLLLFSHAFLSSTPLIAGIACGDLLRAFGWIFGSTLLPQGLRARWAALGLSVTVAQFGFAWVLLPVLGPSGFVVGYGIAWTIGAVLVVVLSGRTARVEPASCVLAAVLLVPLLLCTVLVTAHPERLFYVVPAVCAAVLFVVGFVVHTRRGGTVLSDLGGLVRGGRA